METRSITLTLKEPMHKFHAQIKLRPPEDEEYFEAMKDWFTDPEKLDGVKFDQIDSLKKATPDQEYTTEVTFYVR